MALKRILESLDGVPADVAKEYKEVDGKFVLDIDGDSLDPLINAKNHEKAERQKAEAKARELEEKLLDLHRGAVSRGDLEAIENSYKEKIASGETQAKEREKKLTNRLEKATRRSHAMEIARSLSDSPALMLPYVEKRLGLEFTEDDEAIIRVKGADGKPSALTIEDLKKELVANPDLRAIIRGSAGTGGQNGSQGAGSGSGAAGKKLKDLSEAERVALYRSNPDEFKRLVDEAKAEA